MYIRICWTNVVWGVLMAVWGGFVAVWGGLEVVWGGLVEVWGGLVCFGWFGVFQWTVIYTFFTDKIVHRQSKIRTQLS